MSWGPIQLRLKGSRQIEFDGEASPAPGGGSMPMQKVTVGFADIVDRMSDGNGWAPLFVAPDNTFVWVIASDVTVAFDDSDATQVPQVVDDQNNINAAGGLFDALNAMSAVGSPPRSVVAVTGSFGLVAVDTQTIWMFVSPWRFDGAAGSIDLYVQTLTA